MRRQSRAGPAVRGGERVAHPGQPMELAEAVGPRGAQTPGQNARPNRDRATAGRDHAPDVAGRHRLSLAARAGCAGRRRGLSRSERGIDPMIAMPHLDARASRPVPAAPGGFAHLDTRAPRCESPTIGSTARIAPGPEPANQAFSGLDQTTSSAPAEASGRDAG
jgi:hypothetical protein